MAIFHQNQRKGAALITVLVVLTVLTWTLLDYLDRTREDWAIATAYRDRIHSRLLCRSALAATREQLLLDDSGIDWLGEKWAKPFLTQLPGANEIRVELTDEQSLFNINTVLIAGQMPHPGRMAVLQRLLSEKPEGMLISPLLDWMDTDDVPRRGGAERSYYAQLRPPRFIRNGPITSMAELSLIHNWDGWTASRRAAASAPITVYGPGLINVNTASAGVLEALVPSAPPAAIAAVIDLRWQKPFHHVDEFFDALGTSAADRREISPQLTVRTQYFRFHVDVTINDLTSSATAILRRVVRRIQVVEWAE